MEDRVLAPRHLVISGEQRNSNKMDNKTEVACISIDNETDVHCVFGGLFKRYFFQLSIKCGIKNDYCEVLLFFIAAGTMDVAARRQV